jgi:hypothetical protein
VSLYVLSCGRHVALGWGEKAVAWGQRQLPRLRHEPLIVAILVLVAGLVHGLQMSVTPALVTIDDEGTYVAQAWAILTSGELAHYTYWYDHPPLGWIQIAGWALLNDGFDWVPPVFGPVDRTTMLIIKLVSIPVVYSIARHLHANRLVAMTAVVLVWAGLTNLCEVYGSAIVLGRDFMLVAKLASVALLYILARRLGMNRLFAILTVLLFALNPLSIFYQRLTFLDNIAVPWVLAAFVLAASPKNRISATIGSALCFAAAILTKETIAVVFPALLYQMYRSRHPKTWRMNRNIWFVTFFLAGFFYILMAVIKRELVPGPGHVDMWSAIKWQLFDRAPSGSIFDPGSPAALIAGSWARLDKWMLILAAAAILPAWLNRNLRPVTLAYAIQLVVMLRPGGYLPQPYVIALMPFAALVLAGTVYGLWNSGALNRFYHLRHQMPRTGYSYAQVAVQAPALALVAAFALTVVVPQWKPRVHDLMTNDRNVSVRQAMEWVELHVPTRHGDGEPVRIVVSDTMWVDLKKLGYEPEWYFKVDLDPEVNANYPRGWQDVSYVIFTNEMNEIAESNSRQDMTTTLEAREHGHLVAAFGSRSERIWIYQVQRPPAVT